MRRKLNFKGLACLLLALALCATCVHFLHGFQVRRNASALLQQADRAEEQGQHDRAGEYFKRYLALVPSDKEALARYALLLYKQSESGGPRPEQEYRRVFGLLNRALTRAPERHDVRHAFVDVAMKLRNFAEARESLEFLLHNASPGDGKLLRLLAQCQEAGEQYEEADKTYVKSIKAVPHEVEGYVLHARLLRRWLNQPNRADGVMDQMVADNPKDFKAYLTRGDYRKEYDSPEKGNEDVRQAYKLAPDDAEVLLAMAQLALDRKPPDYVKARGYLEHDLKLHPQDVPGYRALARVEELAQRRPEAIACLRRGLDAVPREQRPDLLWDLANVLAEKEESAEEATKLLADAGFPRTHLNFLDARVRTTRGQWLDASRELERLHKDLVLLPELAVRADLLLGLCYQQLGNPDQQYAACRRAEKLAPTSLEASLGVASALVGMGRLDDAIATYRQLIPREPAAQLEMARLLILRNLRLPRAERDWREAEAVLQGAAKALPGVAEVAVLQAEVRVWKGEVTAARTVLVKAREKRGQDAELWVASAAVEDLDGKSKRALAVLQEAAEKLGDRVELRLALARYWGRHPGRQARPALAKLGQGLEKFKPEEQDRLLRGLANAYALLGDPAEARRLWTELAARHQGDLGIRGVLFGLAFDAGDDQAMTAAVEDLHRIEGDDGTLWRYGNVCQLIWLAEKQKREQGASDPRTLDEARAELDTLTEKRPAWSSLAVRAAQIDVLRGKPLAAIRNYQRAVNELGNREPEALHQLVQLLYRYRRYAEAELVLRKLPEEVALSPAMERVAAKVSFQAENYDRAAALAENVVSQGSKDYQDYLWLGFILSRWPTRQAEAEQALRRAVAMAGDKADARVALVQYLVRKGEKDKAVAEVREAEGKLPPEQAPLVLAPCYEALGDLKKANELYQAALAARPDEVAALRTVAAAELRQSKWEAAEAHLRKITELALTSAEDKAWARRGLALVLAARGDYQHSREALATLGILEEGRPEAGAASAADLRMRAIVLAAQRTRRQRRQAIRVLESLLAQEPPTPDDQFLLAQLYESVGDWPQARQQMLDLLAADGKNALHLVFFAQGLVRHGEVPEAQIWLDKLRRLPGADGSFPVAEIRARVLAARNQVDQAVAVVQEYVANKEAQPTSQAARRAAAAALLEALGRDFPAQARYLAVAEAMYRADAAERPEQRTALASFLGRRGRLTEALRVCEQAWESCPPEAVALTSLTALQDGQPGAAQYRLVEGWLETALAKKPNGTDLLACRACLLDLQGHHDEAVVIYRQVLERDPRNLVALNNLAALSALRGQPQEAQDLIARAMDVAGPLPELRDTRAMACLAGGQTGPAVEELEEAVAERATAVNYFHLAQAYQQQGREAQARDNWKKARAAGLKASLLHPLERPACEALAARLDTK